MSDLFKDIDPKMVHEALGQFSKDFDLLEENFPRLIQEHPHQWAGVLRGELFVKLLHEDLMTALGSDRQFAAVRFINPELEKKRSFKLIKTQPA